MKYYLTTPLYYVNAAPHIGHTYTTLAADTIKRFKRMQGFQVALTTGTDEHGQKVERSAQAAGKSPEEFTTLISNEFRAQWDTLGIRYDHFIRTTDPRHYETVRWLFERCKANGYVYKGSYTGQYCVFDELYVNDAKPGDNCPDCGRPTETVTEENYFFKLSAFADRLLKHYEDNPDFIQPESRRNEVISFVRGGLQDLSITRTTLKWGIPLEGKHVVYVWFDALIGYISAVEGHQSLARRPAPDRQGNPALPRRLLARIPDGRRCPAAETHLRARLAALRERQDEQVARQHRARRTHPPGDGPRSPALLPVPRSRLRTGRQLQFRRAGGPLQLRARQRSGQPRQPHADDDQAVSRRRDSRTRRDLRNLPRAARAAIDVATRAFDAFEFSRGLEAIWSMLSGVDKFIVEQSPWKLAKSTEPGAAQQLDDALYASAETLRIAVALLHPVLPESTANIWAQLGMTQPLEELELAKLAWGQLTPGQKIGMIAPVFPRIEAKSAIDRMRALEEEETARQAKLLGKPAEPPKKSQPPSPKIDIEDFVKVDLRVGQVLSAERVKGADKLLHLKVDIGEPEPRTIVAGIATVYEPEKIVGRKVVIVANLHPRKLRGIESNGMIVAASLEGGKPILAGFLEDVPIGARLK